MPPPHAGAFHHGDYRFGEVLDLAYGRVDPPLIGNAVFTAGKGVELLDVGSRDEGAAGAAEHRDAHLIIGDDGLARRGQFPIHRPSHRVARFGTIEYHRGDSVRLGVMDAPLAHGLIPSARSCSRIASSIPSSARISSVCWPRSGGGRRTRCLVSDSFTGKPMDFTLPSIG